MSTWENLRLAWNNFWREPDYGGLTQDEFEEYEMLGEFMEWRAVTPRERERFNELHNKRTVK